MPKPIPKRFVTSRFVGGTLYVVNGSGASCDQTEGYEALEFPSSVDVTLSFPS